MTSTDASNLMSNSHARMELVEPKIRPPSFRLLVRVAIFYRLNATANIRLRTIPRMVVKSPFSIYIRDSKSLVVELR